MRPELQPLAASGTCLHPLLQAASLTPAGGGVTEAGEQINPRLYLLVTAANLDTFVLASQFAGSHPRFPATVSGSN